jgi:hypothetical protein
MICWLFWMLVITDASQDNPHDGHQEYQALQDSTSLVDGFLFEPCPERVVSQCDANSYCKFFCADPDAIVARVTCNGSPKASKCYCVKAQRGCDFPDLEVCKNPAKTYQGCVDQARGSAFQYTCGSDQRATCKVPACDGLSTNNGRPCSPAPTPRQPPPTASRPSTSVPTLAPSTIGKDESSLLPGWIHDSLTWLNPWNFDDFWEIALCLLVWCVLLALIVFCFRYVCDCCRCCSKYNSIPSKLDIEVDVVTVL